MSENPSCNKKRVEVSRHDLPLCCPMPGQVVWDAHPKVYLPIEEEKHLHCPYCGTEYILSES